MLTPQSTIIEINGKDAPEYLNRLTSVDVKNLAPGQGALGFWLEPKGKIVAAFELWRLPGAAPRFWAEVPSTLGVSAGALLDVLEKFHFGEAIEFKELPVKGEWFTRRMDSRGDIWLRHPDWCMGAEWWTWVAPAGEHLERGPHDGTLSDSEWTRRRIQAASCWPGPEVSSDRTPLELGLDAGVADQKGCYPGQEVIEMTRTRGSPAFRAFRVRAVDANPSNETAKPLGEFGRLTSWDLETQRGIAILRKSGAQEGAVYTLKENDSKMTVVCETGTTSPTTQPEATGALYGENV